MILPVSIVVKQSVKKQVIAKYLTENVERGCSYREIMFSYPKFWLEYTCLVPYHCYKHSSVIIEPDAAKIDLFIEFLSFLPYPNPTPHRMPIATLPSWELFSSDLYNFLMKWFISRVLKAGVWYVGEQEDSFTCLCLCRN